MRAILTLAVALTALSAPAFAQTADRSASTAAFTQACIASPQMQNVSRPEQGCACTAGVLSGRSTDRQFYIAARLTPFGNDNAAMRNEIQRMISEGYTAQEIMEVGTLMTGTGDLINSTCAVFER